MTQYILGFFSGREDAQNVEYITRTNASEVQCLWHHLPPVHQLLSLLLLPLYQRLQLKVHLRQKQHHGDATERMALIRGRFGLTEASYPGGGAVRNGHLLDDSQVSWSRGGHFVVSRSQKTPVVSIFGCKTHTFLIFSCFDNNGAFNHRCPLDGTTTHFLYWHLRHKGRTGELLLPVVMSWLMPSTEMVALEMGLPCRSRTKPLTPRWTCEDKEQKTRSFLIFYSNL